MPKPPKQVIREEILALSAYLVPDSRGMVKLDAMENPYPLPLPLREEIGRLAACAEINRYPDPAAAALKAKVREAMGVPAGMEVMLGNGSDELIQVVALAVARPGATLLSVEPSFVMYRMIAVYAGLAYVGVPLREGFALDLKAVLAAVARHRPAVIFLAFPNNPTGNLFDRQAVERVIEAAPGLVVVDEAYHPFAGASFMGALGRYPNLLVMRTFSKLGLAGLRLGMLAGPPDWLGQLEKLRLPYNVNGLTQAVALSVLSHPEVLAEQAQAIRWERDRLQAQLASIPGVEAYPSSANFILFRVPEPQGVFQGLKERGVLIKNLDDSHPMLAGCLRVTVGTPEENERFLRALKASMSPRPLEKAAHPRDAKARR